ncbi:MAG: ArsA-related P-loop ATPase [Bdellovibrionota bacterium]
MKKTPKTQKNIDKILAERRIIISCGTGGVGKTTLSAAIAMRAAMTGKRAVVITVDPAKRLATSLGLESLDNKASDLTPLLEKACNKKITGRFCAIVPDTKKTFEDFLRDLSPSQEITERVLKNPIFHIFTKEFSGANEYMAMERLRVLSRNTEYDCIVLDTPPSRNTLEFLDAPELLARFFEERLVKWLVLPANKILASGVKKALSLLERLTGTGFMTSLFDFASSLFELRVRFMANLKETIALLESQSVGFIMVTTPTPDTAQEVKHFIDTLEDHDFNFDGVALNRTLGYLKTEALAKKEAKQGIEEALEVMKALQAREEKAMERLARIKAPVCTKLPELARDVHSVEDLFHVSMALDISDPMVRAS